MKLMALLTRQQRRVLELIAHGATLAEAAARMGISRSTAEKHREAAVSRLGAASTPHAVWLLATGASPSRGRRRARGQMRMGL